MILFEAVTALCAHLRGTRTAFFFSLRRKEVNVNGFFRLTDPDKNVKMSQIYPGRDEYR